MKPNTDLPVMRGLRMFGAITEIPHTPLWRAQRELYHYLTRKRLLLYLSAQLAIKQHGRWKTMRREMMLKCPRCAIIFKFIMVSEDLHYTISHYSVAK
jgi:hypothetical protein